MHTPPSSAVVFDANIYRALCGRLTPAKAIVAARRLVLMERAAGIIAVGSQSVAVELASHLAEPGDAHFNSCLSSLCMLAIHCNQDVEGQGHVQMLHMADDMLSKTLYGARTSDALEFASSVNNIVLNVLVDPRPEALARMSQHLRWLAVFVDNVERSYVNLLRRFADRLQDPSLGDRASLKRLVSSSYGRRDAAQFLVQRSRDAFGLGGPEPQLAELSAIVLAKYSAAIEFAVQRASRIIDGADPASDGNSVWDWELSFVVGRFLAPSKGEEPVPIRVVTEDKAIRNSANASGQPRGVLTLPEYRSTIRW